MIRTMKNPLLDPVDDGIFYPEEDPNHMPEGTFHFMWKLFFYQGLELVFRDRDDVFLSSDLFWYPIKGDNGTSAAADVMAVMGRPRGHRSSYRQWMEDDVTPQFVMEIISPFKRDRDLVQKTLFYERFGVQEYVVFNPNKEEYEDDYGARDQAFAVFQRRGARLERVDVGEEWTSPTLGVKFVWKDLELTVYGPDGQEFRSMVALAEERDHIAEERDSIAEERDQLAEERDQLTEERAKLAAKLRELGVDPDSIQ